MKSAARCSCFSPHLQTPPGYPRRRRLAIQQLNVAAGGQRLGGAGVVAGGDIKGMVGVVVLEDSAEEALHVRGADGAVGVGFALHHQE